MDNILNTIYAIIHWLIIIFMNPFSLAIVIIIGLISINKDLDEEEKTKNPQE